MTEVDPKNIVGLLIDYESKQRVIFTSDMLLNQIQRDAGKITSSFDKIHGSCLAECSPLISRAMYLIYVELVHSESGNETKIPARLLSSAAHSLSSSIQLARHGYSRQFGAILRTTLETLCVVLDILIRPGALDAYLDGKYKSTRSIHTAKQAIPLLGEYWGMLSNHFVHINEAHSNLEFPQAFREDSAENEFIDGQMRFLSFLLGAVSELALMNRADELLYWEKQGEGFTLNISDEMMHWLSPLTDPSKT